jgi:acyl-CoA synthetase (AMP-forming)/AMP-acid ligase II
VIRFIRQHLSSAVALIEASSGKTLTYRELNDRVERTSEWLSGALPPRALVFLAPEGRIDAVVLYLASLQTRMPVCLIEPDVDSLRRLLAVYEPAAVLLPIRLGAPAPDFVASPAYEAPGFHLWQPRAPPCPTAVHEELAVLLTTSGSTGNPKLVRLAMRNLEANALSIAQALRLSPEERPLQSLPLQYSYGLSVLNSHLATGSAMALTTQTFLSAEFWEQFDRTAATSFAGVPYMYETLHRLRWNPARHRSLRNLTQAGGALRQDVKAAFLRLSIAANVRFYVMYGQTEATARISVVPPERLGDKLGSIGVAIPGGRLSLEPVPEVPQHNELVYTGPNVMLGYADKAEGLARGDDLRGVLHTGDLGTRDGDGFYALAGRLNRFAKLFGKRVSLPDVEAELEARFSTPMVAAEAPEGLVVYAEVAVQESGEIQAHAARYLAVPPAAIQVRRVDSLPRTASGKKDYKRLLT